MNKIKGHNMFFQNVYSVGLESRFAKSAPTVTTLWKAMLLLYTLIQYHGKKLQKTKKAIAKLVVDVRALLIILGNVVKLPV